MIDHSGVTFRENTVINLSATVCMREIITTQLQNSHSSALCCSSQCSMCKPLQNFCRGSIHLLPIYLFHWAINKASHKALSHRVGNKTDPHNICSPLSSREAVISPGATCGQPGSSSCLTPAQAWRSLPVILSSGSSQFLKSPDNSDVGTLLVQKTHDFCSKTIVNCYT